ncbi:MAG: caspase family protein [Thermoflexibacter sp.]|nr:caspase family protein [Thermoflexibacter sp.]
MKTIYIIVLMMCFAFFAKAQSDTQTKLLNTLKSMTDSWQRYMLSLQNRTERTKHSIAFDATYNKMAENASVQVHFQIDSSKTLWKEKYTRFAFFNNIRLQNQEVKVLHIGNFTYTPLQKNAEQGQESTVSIWHLADYCLGESCKTYLVKYEFQTLILPLQDDFDESAWNIVFKDLIIYKKQMMLSPEQRTHLKNEIPNIENQMNNFIDSPIEIEISSPELTSLHPIKEGYFLVKQDTILLINGKVRNSKSKQLLINDKTIHLSQDGSFTHQMPANNYYESVSFQVQENDMIVKREIHYKGKSRGNPGPEPYDIAVDVSNLKYYALFIGVEDYIDNPRIDDLSFPISDAQALKNVLVENYLFFKEDQIIFVKNPTRAELIGALDGLQRKIAEEVGTGDKDGNKQRRINLLIFYAGHGLWDSDLQKGYWLPKDADRHKRSNWISNDEIRTYISAMKTQHTLLITDACFGGSVLRDVKEKGVGTEKQITDIKDLDEIYRKYYLSKSRKAMTSCGASTKVPDQSVFLKYLVKTLKENRQNQITAGELFYSFNSVVINQSQPPAYGVLPNTDDELGEFIFIKK